MLKIKLFAILGVLSLATIISSISPVFVSKAENDEILQTIAGYKKWTKVNSAPLSFQIDGASGSE